MGFRLKVCQKPNSCRTGEEFVTSTMATAPSTPMETDHNNTHNYNNSKSLFVKRGLWWDVNTAHIVLRQVVVTIHVSLRQRNVLVVSIFNVQSSLNL